MEVETTYATHIFFYEFFRPVLKPLSTIYFFDDLVLHLFLALSTASMSDDLGSKWLRYKAEFHSKQTFRESDEKIQNSSLVLLTIQ